MSDRPDVREIIKRGMKSWTRPAGLSTEDRVIIYETDTDKWWKWDGHQWVETNDPMTIDEALEVAARQAEDHGNDPPEHDVRRAVVVLAALLRHGPDTDPDDLVCDRDPVCPLDLDHDGPCFTDTAVPDAEHVIYRQETGDGTEEVWFCSTCGRNFLSYLKASTHNR